MKLRLEPHVKMEGVQRYNKICVKSGSKILILRKSNLLTQLETNIYVPVMYWALFHGAGL